MPEKNAEKAESPPAHKRDRSPNYPIIGPTEAMKHARTIWERDKRNPLSVDMACQHLGYKAKNGASLPVIAALKRYGLLISAGGEVRVSDEAHKIFLAPEGLPERKTLIKRVAMRPALFGEVLKRFPDGLPSDELLRYRLREEWEFASDQAANNFIKSLKEAMSLAAVAPGEEIADSGSEVTAEEEDLMTQNPAITQPPVENVTPPGRSPPGLPAQTRLWDLGNGAVMSVQIPGKLSKGNVAKLKKYIGALETEAAIAWDDDEPTTT